MSKTTTARTTIGLPDFADRLGLHRATLHLYVKQGKLKAIRIGRSLAIEPDEQDRFTRWLADRAKHRPNDSRIGHVVRRGRLHRRNDS